MPVILYLLACTIIHYSYRALVSFLGGIREREREFLVMWYYPSEVRLAGITFLCKDKGDQVILCGLDDYG